MVRWSLETVGAKRSPILGYNHNVRYRGIVFHVQTEDSGIINPHVFTHLFHGGVILSTRKIVYDPDAAEEVVKSLMQAQHKAAMKDLKRGHFDDKIDQYLAGAPGLLPRGSGAETARPGTEGEAPAVEVTIEASEPNPSQPAVAPPIAPLDAPGAEPPSSPELRMGRAPTERAPALPSAALDSPADGGRRDISEAMAAIQAAEVSEAELAAAGLAEAAEVHSPAPPSASPPPGGSPERPGQYIVTRRNSQPLDARSVAPQAPRPPIPRPTPPSSRLPTPPAATPQMPSGRAGNTAPPATFRNVAPPAPSGPISRPTPPAIPRLTTPPRPVDGALPARPAVGTPPPAGPIAKPPTQPQTGRGRPTTGGGVVVSRPAVIVGGPPRTVGTPPPAAPPPPSKVRRAKDPDGGIGGDLISERSLDEVILAYLSEDTSDE